MEGEDLSNIECLCHSEGVEGCASRVCYGQVGEEGWSVEVFSSKIWSYLSGG